MCEYIQDIEVQKLERITEIFKSLSDGTRLRILHLLLQQECSVGHISHTLEISQSNVSHQLRILKQAHLVRARRDGQSKIYQIDDDHVKTLLQQALNHVSHHQEG
ncbi:metalloregulator ArsR/SmtB family transcription factor [Staphylococcus sp. SQ8-PEA]|uniref:Metalloregulator ArsR/SmtB family transcription factor n=1 Tax=Staphylococcus marylandisciuri TaxID=2981529 RepID=A0ABT2QRJ5_9STAP|nr:metalloregulator ArsR/SmtB family transcription factor [Staphylococcus marylandisciuri]MCU5746610.1 metalloregulator ArsR/SmtB family transcription factor [Staphylococcus marylandisciuri]